MAGKRFLILAIVIAGATLCKAQSVCDTLEKMRNNIKDIYTKNRSTTDKKERKNLYFAYKRESKKAASLVTRCINFRHLSDFSKDNLISNYIAGKLYYQAGECSEAAQKFNLCLNNPYCKNEKLGSLTYEEVIKNNFKCNSGSRVDDIAAANGYSIQYSGKGSAFIKKMFEEVDASMFDDMPLMPDEIEQISNRTILVGDSINAIRALQLSGTTSFVLSPPFVLMTSKDPFISIPIEQTKNLNYDKEGGAPAPDLAEYQVFLSKHFNSLTEMYFNKYADQKKLISVYLIGGDYNSNSLKNFLSFSKSIHLRAHRRVAYYLPIDNSIVAWASSGGGTLVHELVHALIKGDFPDAPLWINEGMAALFEEGDNNGVPLNNYRLIYVQLALLNDNICIQWTDLMNMEQYTAANETNYNLLSAYGRYFCKFLYDRYGQIFFKKVYQTLRDSTFISSAKQVEVICELTGKSVNDLQAEWQAYLLTQEVSDKWTGLIPGISKEIRKQHRWVFEVSPVESPTNEILKTKDFYHTKLRKVKRKPSKARGTGQQQF